LHLPQARVHIFMHRWSNKVVVINKFPFVDGVVGHGAHGKTGQTPTTRAGYNEERKHE